MDAAAFEGIRAIAIGSLLAFLVNIGRDATDERRDWNFIVGGFALLLFANVLDVTDNFQALNMFVVIGDTPTAHFLEEYVGYLGGTVLIAIGLLRWVPGQLEERVAAQKKLEESRDVIRALADNVPELITLKDASGRYMFVNRCFEEWTGMTRIEVLGRRASDVYPRELAERFDEQDAQAMAERLHVSVEEEVTYPDGNARTVSITRFPVISRDGSVFGVGNINLDVTAIRAAERDQARQKVYLRSAIDNLSAGLFMIDSDLTIRAINQKCIEFYGFSPSVAFEGANFADLVRIRAERGDYGPCNVDMIVEKKIESWTKGGRRRYFDEVNDSRVLEILRAPMDDGGIVCVINDITDRRRAEEQAQRKSALIDLLRQTARDANRANDLNEAMENAVANICQFCDWPVGHALVRKADDEDSVISSGIWHMTDPERFLLFRGDTDKTSYGPGTGLLGRVLASGEPAWIPDIANDEHFRRAASVQEVGLRAAFAFPVLVGRKVVAVLEFFSPDATPVASDLFETLVNVGTLLGRVAERDRAKKALMEERHLLDTTLNSIDQGFLVFDENFELMVANRRMRELWNYPQDLVRPGCNAADVVRYNAAQGCYGEGDPDELAEARIKSYKNLHEDQEEQFWMASGRALLTRRYRVENLGWIVTSTDITDILLAEKQLQKSERQLKRKVIQLEDRESRLEAQAVDLVAMAEDLGAARDELSKLNDQKDKFFSIIAHDLRGPFTTLLGYTDLLSERSDDADRQTIAEWSSIVGESARRAFDLLENLLEWSRLQMGRIDVEPEPMEVDDVVETNLVLFEHAAATKGVALSSSGETSLMAFANPQAVDTILRNFIHNAIKFTPRGGSVTINVSQDGQMVTIDTIDTGIGIAPEKIAILFDVSQKTTTPGTDGEPGTGLGMPLCKELAEKLGAYVHAESKPAEGSVFSLSLPEFTEKKAAKTASGI